MATMTHDMVVPVRHSTRAGLGFAVLAAASFGLSGSLASGLMDAGWSPAALVLCRVSVAALVLVVPAALALRGRWGLLRANAGLIASYGVVAVAGCQLAFFSAVDRLPVAVALLLEYTAPVAVVGWLWLRHHQRLGRLTVAGAVVAGLGLLLVLDVFGRRLGRRPRRGLGPGRDGLLRLLLRGLGGGGPRRPADRARGRRA